MFTANIVYCEINNNIEIIEKADEYMLNDIPESKYGKPISQYGIMKMRGKTIADYKLKDKTNEKKVEAFKKEVIYWVNKIVKPKFIPKDLEAKLVELDDFPPLLIQNDNIISKTSYTDFIIANYKIDNYVITINDAKDVMSIDVYNQEGDEINNITNYVINQLEYFFNFTTNDIQKYAAVFYEQTNDLFYGKLVDKTRRSFWDGSTYLYDWKLGPWFSISKNYIRYSFSKGENRVVDVSRIKRVLDTFSDSQRF